MDDLYPFLADFRAKIEAKEDEKQEQNGVKTAFHSAYAHPQKREDPVPQEPLNFLEIRPKMWQKVLQKLSYQEIARMETTCKAMAGLINEKGIVGNLEAFGLHFKDGSMCIGFDKSSYHNYTLEKINDETTAAIWAKILLIEDEMNIETAAKIKKLLEENEARVETIQLGSGHHFAFAALGALGARITRTLVDTPEFYEMLTITRAKRLISYYGLYREDLRREEIKQLEALELHGSIEDELTPPVLRQILCPVLTIGNNIPVSAETLTSLLQQWKENQRSIKCLTINSSFGVQEVLNPDEYTDLDAIPIWTYYEQDRRIINLLPMGKAFSPTNIQILLIKRGEQRNVTDFLVLFFGAYRFVAATLDGIVDENVLDQLKSWF